MINIKRIVIKIIVFLLIIAFTLVLGNYAFSYFKRITGAKLAFREAKNVNICMKNFDIEKYGEGGCVYNPKYKNNLAKGLKENVDKLLEHDCYLSIISYDKSIHKVTNFIYGYNDYLIEYKYENNQDSWSIKYIKEIIKY